MSLHLRQSERTRHAVSLQILLVMVCLILLAACGKKGPVRPLLKPLPAAPRQAEAQQVGSEIVLTMELPDKNQDGTPLTDLAAVRIYRRETADGVCNACDEPNELWHEVDPEYPRDARLDGRRLTLRDSNLRPGFGYRYRIVAITRSGVTGASTSLSRVFEPIPEPLLGLTATGFDRMVRLTWPPDAQLPAGWTLVGYNIYRAIGDAPFSDTSINNGPVNETRYEDLGPVNGILYRYAVSYQVRHGESVVESAVSNVVSVTPQLEQ